MRCALILLLSVSLYAQVSSGGPVAQVESKKIVSPAWETPGPEAPRAPLERYLSAAMVASAAFDTGTTIHNLSHGCQEDNPLMGRHPSTSHIVLFEAAMTTGELLAAHFLRRHHHSRLATFWLSESLVEHGVAGGLNTVQKCF